MKILKNRFLIGALCIIFAILIGFFAVPLMVSITNQKMQVMVASDDIARGSLIGADMVQVKEMFASDIPNGAGLIAEDIIGKYAVVDISGEDVITKPKLTADFPYEDEELYTLPNDKMAVAITTPTLSSSVAGKIKPGDIVTVLIVDKSKEEESATFEDLYMAKTYNELLYMQVLNVTTSDGQDIKQKNIDSASTELSKEKSPLPSVVTLLCNMDQARLLANFDTEASIHLALVARKHSPLVQEYLDRQEEYFSSFYIAEEKEGKEPVEEQKELDALELDEDGNPIVTEANEPEEEQQIPTPEEEQATLVEVQPNIPAAKPPATQNKKAANNSKPKQ